MTRLLKNLLINIISAFFDDWRENTIKNFAGLILGATTGGIIGGIQGRKKGLELASKIIFSSSQKRKVIIASTAAGILAGFWGGNEIIKYISGLVTVGFGIDAWFDTTWTGQWIDNKLTYIESWLVYWVNAS